MKIEFLCWKGMKKNLLGQIGVFNAEQFVIFIQSCACPLLLLQKRKRWSLLDQLLKSLFLFAIILKRGVVGNVLSNFLQKDLSFYFSAPFNAKDFYIQ